MGKSKCEKYEKQIEELNERLINYEQNEAMKLKSTMNALREEVAAKDDEIALLKKKNDDLMAKYNKLEKEMEAKQSRIGKLNIQIKEYQTAKMEKDDDTKLKLKQYNVQIITIEENKKLIELLRKQVGEYKTKYQIEQEALVRHKKATKSLEEEAEENEKLIKKQKKKIKALQKELDTSGYGDSKQKSTLSLLRQNVDTLESNIRTKNFEIKKLKNNLKAMGVSASATEETKKLQSENDSLMNEVEKAKKSLTTTKDELVANKELLTTKNEEISKLKIEISELREKQN